MLLLPGHRVLSVFLPGNTHEKSQPAHLKADVPNCANRSAW
jgi:hypothetical protein